MSTVYYYVNENGRNPIHFQNIGILCFANFGNPVTILDRRGTVHMHTLIIALYK